MKTFSQFLNEASLGRFYQHLQNGEPIAIISACRNEVKKKVNQENTSGLYRYINAAGFGFMRAKGGYVEKMITRKKKVLSMESIRQSYTPLRKEKKNFVTSQLEWGRNISKIVFSS